jgi:hypothetical protein
VSYPVTYYCPHCGAYVELEREGYLSDKSVTPYPLEGWEYAAPDEEFESADGVRFVCGEDTAVSRTLPKRVDAGSEASDDDPGARDDAGCGEPFYLSFVRYEDGREVEPRPESEYVRIGR